MGRLEDLERTFVRRMQLALDRGEPLECSSKGCGQKQTQAHGMKIINGKAVCSTCRLLQQRGEEERRRNERRQRMQDQEDQAVVARRLATWMTLQKIQEQGLKGTLMLGQLAPKCPSLQTDEGFLKLARGELDRDKVMDELYEVFVTHGLMEPMKTRKWQEHERSRGKKGRGGHGRR